MSNADELLKLKELLDNGLITNDEFQLEKSKIMKQGAAVDSEQAHSSINGDTIIAPPPSKKKVRLLIPIIIILVAAGIVAAFFLLNQSKDIQVIPSDSTENGMCFSMSLNEFEKEFNKNLSELDKISLKHDTSVEDSDGETIMDLYRSQENSITLNVRIDDDGNIYSINAFAKHDNADQTTIDLYCNTILKIIKPDMSKESLDSLFEENVMGDSTFSSFTENNILFGRTITEEFGYTSYGFIATNQVNS